MNKRIGFVAVGQAGGNVGQLLEAAGYTVLYLNTSKEDLSTLSAGTHKYHITNGEGCNKDRRKAKQLVIDDFDNIAAKIDETIDSKLIYVIFAAGGGTGSGAGPMLTDLLIDEGSRKVGVITILPSVEESVKSQYNAYECFAELTALKSTAGCFILDNDKGDRMELNMSFVDVLDRFIHIPDKYISEKGNIDTAEINEVLCTHGVSILISQASSKVSELVAGIKNSIYAPLENDHKLKYVALAADDSLADTTELAKEFGTPLDIYRAYTKQEAILCLAGCSYPLERLNQLRGIIESNKDIIVSAADEEPQVKMDFDFLSGAGGIGVGGNTAKTAVESKPKTRKDIMSKYLV